MHKTLIKRNQYINQITPFIATNVVKVIVGQRRVGKSYLLLQIIDELKHAHNVKDSEIIYLNKEDLQRDTIKTYQDLYEVTKDYHYIFIDEIQEIEHWEKAIRSLQSTGKHDIYITGSNSDLLSSELSTFLSGRYVSFHIYPLHYQEFQTFHQLSDSPETFEKYLKFGGLPYLKNLQLTEEVVYEYLKDVVNTIILKDVIARNKMRNVDFYKKLITYLANETGNIFSAKSISDYLISQKIGLSPTIVLNYLENSINASFLNRVSRYDLKGKRFFEILQKYYFTDIGIKNTLLGGYKKIQISGLLENVVFCNLIANGWEVSIGKWAEKEIDFVCKKAGKLMYLQVAYVLELEKTKTREFASLLEIPDAREKYVITMDEGASGSIDGVQRINVRAFLMKIIAG